MILLIPLARNRVEYEGILYTFQVPRKNTQNVYMTSWDVHFFYNFSYQTLRRSMIICSALLPFLLPKCLCIDFYLFLVKQKSGTFVYNWCDRIYLTHMHKGKQNKIEFVREPCTYIGRYREDVLYSIETEIVAKWKNERPNAIAKKQIHPIHPTSQEKKGGKRKKIKNTQSIQ